jgi:hypothetical protein
MTTSSHSQDPRPEVFILWSESIGSFALYMRPRAELEEALVSLRAREVEVEREYGPETLAQVRDKILDVEKAIIEGDRIFSVNEHWRAAVESNVIDDEL